MKPPFAAQSQTPTWYDQHAYLLHVNTHRCSIQSANIPPESNALLGSLELSFSDAFNILLSTEVIVIKFSIIFEYTSTFKYS